MKESRKIITSLIILVACLLIGQLTGLKLTEFIGNIRFDLNSLMKVVAIVSALMAIKYIIKMLLGYIQKESTLLTLARSILDYAAIILSVVWSLRILGADINGIIAGLGILGLIIGMSAQDIINDLVTGIFLLFEDEYRVGDIIEVNGFAGRVTEIGVRTTVITDNGGNEKIINNSAMKNILNRSVHSSVAVVDIELPAGADVEKVINADYGDITCLGVETIKYNCTIVRFIKQCSEEEVYDVRRAMNSEIIKVLRKAGVR